MNLYQIYLGILHYDVHVGSAAWTCQSAQVPRSHSHGVYAIPHISALSTPLNERARRRPNNTKSACMYCVKQHKAKQYIQVHINKYFFFSCHSDARSLKLSVPCQSMTKGIIKYWYTMLQTSTFGGCFGTRNKFYSNPKKSHNVNTPLKLKSLLENVEREFCNPQATDICAISIRQLWLPWFIKSCRH